MDLGPNHEGRAVVTGTRTDLIERPQRNVTRDDDFVAWLNGQAALLRQGSFDRLDGDALAEELEGMAKRERRELESRFKLLLQHLLKWEFQPDRRSRSWLVTMDEQRDQIGKLLRDSPSLRNDVPWAIRENYPAAVRDAANETRLPAETFPTECPYKPEEALAYTFRPGPPWEETAARPARRKRR